MAHSKRARENGQKLQQRKFQLGHKENNFPVSGTVLGQGPVSILGDFKMSTTKNPLSNTKDLFEQEVGLETARGPSPT